MGVKLLSASNGSVELVAPSTASNYTATMPAKTGNVMIDGPAFSASRTGSSQTYSALVATKVTYTVENFDTNSNYDTTLSRFTPTVAGYYQVNASVSHSFNGASGSNSYTYLFKNGAAVGTSSVNNNTAVGTYGSIGIASLIYMNGSTDYLEVYTYSNNVSPIVLTDTGSFFQACLIRGA